MVIIPADQSDTGQTTMGLRKLTVTNATKTDTGWRIVAQSPNRIVRFLDVDEEGFGVDCEPWSDELERELGPADPEHNVVMLEQAQAPPRQAEVIDINAAWADRYAKAEGLNKRVNELRAPRRPQDADTQRREFVEAVSAGLAADRPEEAEHRNNVDAFRERVARLITMAWTDEFREGAMDAEAVVRFYSQLRSHQASEFTNKVDELLTGYEALFRALPLRRRDLPSDRKKTGTEIFNDFFAERNEDLSSQERRIQAIAALAQRGQELIQTAREPGFVADAMVRGVTRASERREAERKEADSRVEEAERHAKS